MPSTCLRSSPSRARARARASIVVCPRSGGANAKPEGELIQANLADIGITANVLLVRPKDWVTNVNRAQITLVGYLGGPDPYYNLEWFASSQIKFWNWAFWANKEFDQLLAQLGLVIDPHKRTQIAIR